MPIIRGRHHFDDHYTQIPNAWLRDRRLSYKARGLLAELMSHEPGFSVSRESLSRNGQDGDRAIRTAIAELEAVGYLERSQSRTDDNRFGAAVWITKDPDSPSVRFAPAGNAHAQNVAPKKTIEKKTKEKKEDYVQDELALRFSEFWEVYPRKQNKARARSAFAKALTKTTIDVILVGAQRYKDDPNRIDQFTKQPESWLNGECWDEGPLAPRRLTPEEQAAKEQAEKEARWAQMQRQREEDAKRREQERIEAEQARETVKLCEHDRVAIICPVCNRRKGDSA